MPGVKKALDISKKRHKTHDLGMHQRLYKYYEQKTAIDLQKNHWPKKQIDDNLSFL